MFYLSTTVSTVYIYPLKILHLKGIMREDKRKN
jgi:hypothetical protein